MLVFPEGQVLEGARHYCSGESRYVATSAEVGFPPHPHWRMPGAGGSSSAGEREGPAHRWHQASHTCASGPSC